MRCLLYAYDKHNKLDDGSDKTTISLQFKSYWMPIPISLLKIQTFAMLLQLVQVKDYVIFPESKEKVPIGHFSIVFGTSKFKINNRKRIRPSFCHKCILIFRVAAVLKA